MRSFSTPRPDRDPGDPFDLLEVQDLVARQELEVPPEDLLRHAVGAAEVAAVGHRDAQVAHRAPARVLHAGPTVTVAEGMHPPIVARPLAGPRSASLTSGPEIVLTAGANARVRRPAGTTGAIRWYL